MFGTLGGPELLAIFAIALIVFGPRKLPEIGKSIGKMMAEFRKASNDFKQTIESEVEAEKLRDAVRIDPFLPSSSTESRSTSPDDPSAHSPEGSVSASSSDPVPAPLVDAGPPFSGEEASGGETSDGGLGAPGADTSASEEPSTTRHQAAVPTPAEGSAAPEPGPVPRSDTTRA